jgi:phosphopantetheine--protein transferase-like protein
MPAQMCQKAVFIGSDVVDLSFFGQPAYCHIGFLDRVCTSEEVRMVRTSISPNRLLAVIWAAKEASYKLFAKQLGLTHFLPKQIEVDLESSSIHSVQFRLESSLEGNHAEVNIFADTKYVHATALVQRCRYQWQVRATHCAPETGLSPYQESTFARQVAANLIARRDWQGVGLQFVDDKPFLRNASGLHLEADVSLSHHGSLVSAAIAWNPAGDIQSLESPHAGTSDYREEECFSFTE